MKTRILVIATLMAFILSTLAFAQGNQPGAAKKGQRGDRMAIARQLNLSQEQARQIRQIVQNFRAEVRAIAKSDTPKEQKMTKIKDLKAQASAAIMNVLTPEQKQKAEQMNLTKRILSPGKRHGAGFARILAQLNLSETQKTAIRGIMKAHVEKVKALRQNTTLTPEAKRSEMKKLRTDLHAQIRAQLTPEQQTKFDDLIAKRKAGPKAGQRGGRG